MTGPFRVTPAASSRREGDEPVDVDPATSVVEAWGPGRAVVHGDRDTWALLGDDRAATAARPRTVEVVVDGWRFELEVEPVRTAEIRARAMRTRSASVGLGSLEIRAMIPGRVVSVAVAAGDVVAAGQTILVIEAMKMQNELRAPHGGTIERVVAGEGETIELGQLLAILAVDG